MRNSICNRFDQHKTAWLMVLLTTVICCYFSYVNTQLSEKNREDEIQSMSEWLRMQDCASLHDLSAFEVTDTNGVAMPLSNIVSAEKRVGVYVNRMFCSDCWKVTVRDLALTYKKWGVDKPFVLLEGFNIRDVKIMAREDSLGLPLYLLVEHDNMILDQLALEGEPFIFFLHDDGKISSITYIADIMRPIIHKYLETSSSSVSLTSDSLVLLNPVIDLGHVPYRTKFNLTYVIVNNNNKSFNITDVDTSCGCIALDSISFHLNSRSKTYVTAHYLSDSWGKFTRYIRLFTNQRKEPYILTVTGYCD